MARFSFFSRFSSGRGGNKGGGSKVNDPLPDLNGTDHNDTLYADKKGQTVNGRGGDDILNGSFGSDTLNGGDGNDRLTDNTNFDDSVTDTLNGGAGDDVLRSHGGADVLEGEAGNDTLTADGAGSVLSGGAGDDRLFANGANSRVDGGDGIDFAKVDFSGTSTDQEVNLQSGEMITLSNGTTIQNVEAFEVVAGKGDDTITLTDFEDEAFGNDGNDAIFGGGARDRLNGGNGDDYIDGGDGDDIINGDDGADILLGGSGDDLIRMLGGDTVFGGKGADTFRVSTPPTGSEAGRAVDVIKDFSIEEGDVLDFRDLDASRFADVFGAPGSEIESGIVVLEDTDDGVLISINGKGRFEDGSSNGEDVPTLFVEGVTGAELIAADAFVFDPFLG